MPRRSQSMEVSNEAILEARGVGPCTHLRGSLLANNLTILDRRGLRSEYEERLPDEHVPTIREISVSQWYPIELGLAHYGVMSELVADPHEQIELGRESAAKLQLPYIKTLVRAMRVAGAIDPKKALTISHKVFDRVLQGADGRVDQVGRKDARLTCLGIPLVQHPYFRNSWQGWWETSLSLVARKVFVRIEKHDGRDVHYLASWV